MPTSAAADQRLDRCLPIAGPVHLLPENRRPGREHIIALGLKGTLIFLDASCPVCAKTINEEVEQLELQVMYGPLRARFDMHNRRHRGGPRKRSKSHKVQYGRASEDGTKFEPTRTEEVPNEALPIVIPGLNLGPPGILLGLPPSEALNGGLWIKKNDAEILKFLKDGEGYKIASIQPLIFCRMLEKLRTGLRQQNSACAISICCCRTSYLGNQTHLATGLADPA